MISFEKRAVPASNRYLAGRGYGEVPEGRRRVQSAVQSDSPVVRLGSAMIGQRILHYEIVEMLGRGGMGVVYKARDTHLDRFVAIKVLPPEKVADAGRKRRFVQEAKAASALNHPNIVHIYDIADVDGIQFIAMEYVAGKTLDQIKQHVSRCPFLLLN
jgi:serine/threonine protein kinase